MKSTLFYIHDPMCSYCYAFKPVLQQLYQQLIIHHCDTLETITLLGGLAADTELPMPATMRQKLRATWQQIEQNIPATRFNYAFWDDWQHSRPRRATYPACRAVIAAHSFDRHDDNTFEKLMIDAIQTAYYQQALNPSDNDVLIQLATQIGLNKTDFKSVLLASQTQQQLLQQITQCQQMNVHSYPSLILQIDSCYRPISIDYQNSETILDSISQLISIHK